MSLAELIAEAKRSGDLRALVGAVPYAKFLGLDVEVADGELVTAMRYAPELIGNPSLPALHGGTLGALLESAAIFELIWRHQSVLLPKTITITVDFLRSGAPRDTYARASITRQGRRVANVRVEAWQQDRNAPVATAHAIFLVMAAEA